MSENSNSGMIQQMEGGVELLVVDGFSADTDSVKGWDSK